MRGSACLTLSAVVAVHVAAASAQTANPLTSAAARGEGQREAARVTDNIWQATGFGNTFMITTSEGNVIVDTSGAAAAPEHVRLLKAKSTAPVKYIILTHAHGDHTGGVQLWREAGTKVIAQKNHVEFVNYQARLNGFFAVRNQAQFGSTVGAIGGRGAGRGLAPWPGNYGGRIQADVLFDDRYEFTLGGVTFQLFATPGETPDHLSVWIPQWRVAFTGDNYYESFPNMYTLRGTEPRWALDYVHSLDTVLSWKPEIVLPSHGQPIRGGGAVTEKLTRSRDAIQYVHDEVVKGMNAGTDVYTLMREIHLPDRLAVGESYGKLTWSIRGIYEGYAGWFDMNPASIYDTPPSAIYPDLVRLAGGPAAVAKLAADKLAAGAPVEGLRLTDAALAVDPVHRGALDIRLKILEYLKEHSDNSNELGWLDFSIREVQGKIR
jgi:alkyl sulfatase BDS1-like metallo-beta-lactamase superfamily hydrolase